MAHTLNYNLIKAAKHGHADEVLALLKDNPGLDVNWADQYDPLNALHKASHSGHVEVVKLLLAHPNINVNKSYISRRTPFRTAVSLEECRS